MLFQELPTKGVKNVNTGMYGLNYSRVVAKGQLKENLNPAEIPHENKELGKLLQLPVFYIHVIEKK